ncbi:MAG: GNAT family N-acetyltransferase [Pseudomonadota bacterium]|nr:GNAT family N-acetyltransferase [Pseudomonadota bacterium]
MFDHDPGHDRAALAYARPDLRDMTPDRVDGTTESHAMQVDIIRPDEIDGTMETIWRGFQATDRDLQSPFFTPDFCRIVGAVRPQDTRVAVLHEQGVIKGFFAYHVQRLGRIAPLAGPISDYHGVVAAAGTKPDMTAMMKAAGAKAYDFNHALKSQGAFADHAFRETASPYVDLTVGFETWAAERKANNRSFRELARRTRKLERDHGEIRYVANDTTDTTWAQFLDWKRASLDAMGVKFILDQDWARDVVQAIRFTDTPAFAGMTSSLYAGDTCVAVHFGMRSAQTLHWWFPSYDEAYRKTSPGLILILETLKQLDAEGRRELDFGRGDQRYKTDFMTHERLLAEGSLERPLSLIGLPRRLRKQVQGLADRLPSPKASDFARRAGDRLLAAGRLR